MSSSMGEYYRGLEVALRARAAVATAAPARRAAAVHAALPTLLPGDDAPPAACGEGCAHCCHFPVGVTFAEAVRLAQAVADDPALCARIADEADATGTASWHDLAGRPCPLLRNGACARYDARPVPCRALASADRDACAHALAGGAPPPRDEAAFWRGLGACAALDEGHGRRELRAALAALLSTPGGEPAMLRAFAAARTAP